MTDDFGDFGDYKEYWGSDNEECPNCKEKGMTMAWRSTKTDKYICINCTSKESGLDRNEWEKTF